MRVRTSYFTHFRVTLENSHRQSKVGEKGEKQRARLHFPLAVAPSFLRVLVVGTGTRADYQRMGFGVRLPFFFLSPLCPYLLYASFAILLRDKPRWTLYTKPLRRRCVTRRGGLYTAARVDRIAKVPVPLVHAIQIITKYSD